VVVAIVVVEARLLMPPLDMLPVPLPVLLDPVLVGPVPVDTVVEI
jgi:hypothetical protein